MVVKKTVAFHPTLDRYIRKLWSMLIEEGYDASYSSALNYMILEHILSVLEDGINPKVAKNTHLFLDEKIVDKLNLEDYAFKVDDLLERGRSMRKDTELIGS